MGLLLSAPTVSANISPNPSYDYAHYLRLRDVGYRLCFQAAERGVHTCARLDHLIEDEKTRVAPPAFTPPLQLEAQEAYRLWYYLFFLPYKLLKDLPAKKHSQPRLRFDGKRITRNAEGHIDQLKARLGGKTYCIKFDWQQVSGLWVPQSRTWYRCGVGKQIYLGKETIDEVVFWNGFEKNHFERTPENAKRECR